MSYDYFLIANVLLLYSTQDEQEILHMERGHGFTRSEGKKEPFIRSSRDVLL